MPLFVKGIMNLSLVGKIFSEAISCGMANFVTNTSFFWNGFLRVYNWINTALCYKVGNGLSVLVGIDPIVGLEKSYGLSQSLLNYLNDYGIATLKQVRNLSDRLTSGSYWLVIWILLVFGS